MPEVEVNHAQYTHPADLGGLSDFEDIMLAHEAHEEDAYRYSNMSTPTLTSDSSSLRSSVLSWSSPTLATGPFAMRSAESLPRKLSLPDNTSMASLSRIPVSQRRSHKQRETEYSQDTDDFWPTDALMFNVPMTPALCAQEKRPPASRKQRNLPAIKEKEHELDADTREIQLKYANKKPPRSGSSKSLSREDSSASAKSGSRPAAPAPQGSRPSLTRPEHLPPKSREEERRHMVEYNRLLAHVKAQEKAREEERSSEERRKSLQNDADAALWKKALQKGTPVDRKLWWRGVPSKYRNVVWPGALNAKPINVLAAATPSFSKEIAPHTARVFTESGLFEAGRPLHEVLLAVTETVAELRQIPLSAAHNLLHPAAVLLMVLDESKAAACLAQLLPAEGLVHAVLVGNEGIAEAHYASYYKVFRAKFPHLYPYFTSIRLAPRQYLDELISPLVTHLVSPDSACRLMDLMVSEGESFLLRCALGLLRIREPLLYQTREQALEVLRTPIETPEDKLVETIKSISR